MAKVSSKGTKAGKGATDKHQRLAGKNSCYGGDFCLILTAQLECNLSHSIFFIYFPQEHYGDEVAIKNARRRSWASFELHPKLQVWRVS